MKFKSHNHRVFLIKENEYKFVKKVGDKFPERIRREYKILKILSEHRGIPQLKGVNLSSKIPFVKLKYIDARQYDNLEQEQLVRANIKIARWLKEFATSNYHLPSKITNEYSARQRDFQAFKKVKAIADKIHVREIILCIDRIHEYQQRDRIHCAHRDFRTDHVLINGNNIYVIDWESASNGYILQDAGNFIASVIKKDIKKTRYLNTFAEELVACTKFTIQELVDWTIFSLLWGSQIQKKLGYMVEADRYLHLAKQLAVKNHLKSNVFF